MQNQPTKLYIVTNASLSPGLQTAQAVHAAFSFAYEYPDEMSEWHRRSNFVVVLSAEDEGKLLNYWRRLESPNRILVREPDLNNMATAFAALGPDAGRTLSALPLCLKELSMA